MEADRRPQSVHPLLGSCHVGRRQDLVAWPPLRGDLGMQLERHPFDLDVVLPLQPFDSDRVDVAKGSNVVGIDPNWRRHRSTICGNILISTSGSILLTIEPNPLD